MKKNASGVFALLKSIYIGITCIINECSVHKSIGRIIGNKEASQRPIK